MYVNQRPPQCRGLSLSHNAERADFTSQGLTTAENFGGGFKLHRSSRLVLQLGLICLPKLIRHSCFLIVPYKLAFFEVFVFYISCPVSGASYFFSDYSIWLNVWECDSLFCEWYFAGSEVVPCSFSTESVYRPSCHMRGWVIDKTQVVYMILTLCQKESIIFLSFPILVALHLWFPKLARES